MNQRMDQPTAHSMPSDGLALGLALPSARLRARRQTVLGSLPFLALGRHGQGPVTGTALDDNRITAMAWAGPNVPGWSDRTALDRPAADPPHAAVAAARPGAETRTGSGAGPGGSDTAGLRAAGASGNRTPPAATPELGIMFAATAGAPARRQVPPPEVRRQGPALLGLIGQGVGRPPRATAEPVHAMPERRDRVQDPLGAAAQDNSAQPKLQANPAPARASASIVGRIAASLAPSEPPASGMTKNESARPGVERWPSRAVPPGPERGGCGPRSDAEPAPRSAASAAGVPGRALLGLLPALAFRAGGTDSLRRCAPEAAADAASPGANRLIVSAGPGRAGTDSPRDVPDPSALPEPRSLPGRGALATAGSLGAAIGALDGLVERKVDAVIERRGAAGGRTRDPESMSRRPGTDNLADEGAVRALMQKMRDLAQEEQFRSGRLS